MVKTRRKIDGEKEDEKANHPSPYVYFTCRICGVRTSMYRRLFAIPDVCSKCHKQYIESGDI